MNIKKYLSPSCCAALGVFVLCTFLSTTTDAQRKIFDVHIHGSRTSIEQLTALQSEGVYRACISTSWPLQEEYRKFTNLELTYGLMLPCPEGKVPYSLQQCFENGNEYPDIDWVEEQIKLGKIDFLGEILSQYYGISSSDSSLFPYYELAVKYNLPVGVHTGSAGPDHGCPNFSEAMGNPVLLREMLEKFPGMKVWIMHGGVPYLEETIRVMQDFPNVYTDLSAINFQHILPQKEFESVVKELIDAGLENRIMFGSDNNDIRSVVNSIEILPGLSPEQKEKIFFKNAEHFFGRK